MSGRETLTIEALSAADFATKLDELPHETRAVIVATENGAPWATVDISPMTGTARAVFPNYPGGFRGDTCKRGQAGGIVFPSPDPDRIHVLHVVVNRARRMAAAQ